MAVLRNRWGLDFMWAPIREPFVTYDGTPGDDIYTGTGDDDVINGLVGNDILFGVGGNDQINGGIGNDYLEGGVGDDALNGDADNDVLVGGAGADAMAGGAGNDQYLVDSLSDQVIEAAGAGDDIVFTQISYTLASDQDIEELAAANGTETLRLDLTGNAFNNRLYGNNGVNVIVGGGGADIMAGFGGNDQYLVDDAGDRVIEFVGGGDDIVFTTVSFALGSDFEVEELAAANAASTTRLDLAGNEFANRLYGNAGLNVIIGGGGADLMAGFGGDDQYLVDNAGDRVVEGAGGGYDIVFTLASYTLAPGVAAEELAANDPSATFRLDLTGNEFANLLVGNAGVNVLIGGVGPPFFFDGRPTNPDTLVGLGGDDQYLVTATGDRVLERAGEGRDIVFVAASAESWTATSGQEIEEIAAANPAGTSSLLISGNNFDQRISGNNGNNTFLGEGGADTFVFDAATATTGIDSITGFQAGLDKIELNDDKFIGLASVTASNFVRGNAAQDADDRIIFDFIGRLYFDPDGTGAAAAIEFARLSFNTQLSPSDFVVI